MSSDPVPSSPSDVRVHIRLGGLRLDYHGARSFYERHVESFVASAARLGVVRPEAVAPAGAPEPAARSPISTPRRVYEPRSAEFGRYVRRLGPDTDAPDRQVLAFAFYLWNYEKQEVFGLDEIEGCLHAIGRTLPDDAPAVLASLVEARLLEATDERQWKLSKRGESFVKTRLLTL
jgi:hypothetical protein